MGFIEYTGLVPESPELASEAAVLSYMQGPAVPFLDLTLSQALSETAAKFPNR